MLSYQHSYHAGHLADIMKHLALTCILEYLTQKDKPLFYLETHAGRGRYDLCSNDALKTGEHLEGITRLWPLRNTLPALFIPYIASIQKHNSKDMLRYYPGSPLFALELLRPEDRLIACELHPYEFNALKTIPHPNRRIFFTQTDGIMQLKAQLPPPERRGLIFCDPSYEIKTEYRQIPAALKAAVTTFSTGVYCLWYPLTDPAFNEVLYRECAGITAQNTLRIEWHWKKTDAPGMTGCGLFLINPPYRLAAQMKEAFACLREPMGLLKELILDTKHS